MRGWLGLLLLGVFAFGLALIVTLPARVLSAYLPESIAVAGVQGTVWNGSARRMRIQDFDLGEVRWALQPLALVTVRLAAEIEVRGPELQGQGVASTGWGGPGVADLTLSGDSTLLEPYIARYGAAVAGPFEADIPILRIDDQGPQALDGEIVWNDARLQQPTELAFGDVRITLDQNADTAIARLRNDGEALGLNGRAQLARGWAYEARLQVAPTDATPEDVRNALPVLGNPDASGTITLRREGQLSPPL